jgi:SAM-dependent methyltransferase
MTANEKVQRWWAENPMTYGSTHGRTEYDDAAPELGTPEFFQRLDREFFGWNGPLHGTRPFDRIFPYDAYSAGKRVVEIGCGLGTMAMLWAQAGASVTAVDLNPTSVTQTRRRFELLGLQADIRLMDATHLEFADAQFDYAYSWGVLHHSPNLPQSVAEMMRVLKPGGEFGLMLYNRRSILHWYMTEYLEGFLHRERRFLSSLELASRYGDGAREEGNPHTWPVTKREVREMLAPHAHGVDIRVLGTDLDVSFRWMLPGLGLLAPRWMKKPWARRFGWSLWISGRKRPA